MARGGEEELHTSRSPKKRMWPGDLKVLLKGAKGIKDDRFLGMGKANSYAEVSVGSEFVPGKLKGRTVVHKRAGPSPEWNQEFNFHIEHGGFDKNTLHVSFYDKHHLSADEPLGSSRIILPQALENGYSSPFQWYSVYYYSTLTGKPREWGKVELALSFKAMEKQGVSESPPELEGLGGPRTTFGLGVAGTVLAAGQLVVGAMAL